MAHLADAIMTFEIEERELTLRDRLACATLPSLIAVHLRIYAGQDFDRSDAPENSEIDVANAAYRYADAMIEARKKAKPK